MDYVNSLWQILQVIIPENHISNPETVNGVSQTCACGEGSKQYKISKVPKTIELVRNTAILSQLIRIKL
jgi:hypothetical protein